MAYRCEASSLEGFVQQIACSYLRHGYWWYVTGRIPDEKDPRVVDTKLLKKYGIDVSESTRARRKQLGRANLQYLRLDRFFALMATKGEHRFFDEEKENIRDIRRIPLRIGGYSISYRRGGRTRSGEEDPRSHAHVEISRSSLSELRAHLLELAVHRSKEKLAMTFYRLPFEPYAPIRRQMLRLLKEVNQARREAGFSSLPVEILPLRRRVVKPFRVDTADSSQARSGNGSSNDSSATQTSLFIKRDAIFPEFPQALNVVPGPRAVAEQWDAGFAKHAVDEDIPLPAQGRLVRAIVKLDGRDDA